ncbi:MAG: ArsR family transcriptional regulator, partial [Pseudomonadota bacterium]
QRIAEGRKAREIDPALDTLARCVGQADADPAVTPVERERLRALHAFMATADGWFGEMLTMPRERRDMLLKLGAKIARFLPKSKAE